MKAAGVIAIALWLVISVGCRSIPPLGGVNTEESGWTLRTGQAVWQPSREAPEIAGEIVFASNPDGRTLLQFTKNPLPFVTVQTSNASWQIEFVPQKRRFSGRGTPVARLIWVHLARALNGVPPPGKLEFHQTEQQDWTIENRSTGERVAGFLAQ